MYPQPEKPTPWWLEALAALWAAAGILFWPLLAIFAAITALLGLIFAFSAGWGWGLLALALIAAAVAAFAWWDRRRPPQL